MTIVLDDKEYQVKDLTIEQYEALKQNPDIKDYELIHMLTDAPIDDIKSSPFHQVKFVSKMLMSDWITDGDVSPLELVVVFNGVKYGLIQPSKMSYEEWINLEVFLAEDPLDLVKISTHLYRPLKNDKVGEFRELQPYSLDECMERMEEFKKFPIKKFMSAFFFLSQYATILIDNILSSMEKKGKKPTTIPKIIQKKK
jgi:hypothetical protein